MEIFLFIAIALGLLAIWGFSQIEDDKGKANTLRAELLSKSGGGPNLVKRSSLGTIRGLALGPTEFASGDMIGEKPYVLVYPKSKIMGAEVITDAGSVMKTNRGSQAVGVGVGAVLAGPVGAIIGGLSASKSEKAPTKVKLRLLLSDVSNPTFDIDFIELGSAGLTPGPAALDEAKQWLARVNAYLA